MLTRRQLLGALGAALAGSRAVARPLAWDGQPRLETGQGGTTIEARLAEAPFPSPGELYGDDTVAIFVPSYFRAAGHDPDVLLHFHGHYNHVDNVLATQRVREQLVLSRQNAILIAPQGPFDAEDSSGGKLERAGGLKRLLLGALEVCQHPAVVKALGAAALPPGARPGRVLIGAHSGGYRVTALASQLGEVEISEIYLFDALFSRMDAFRDWVAARQGKSDASRHKLVSIYRPGKTEDRNRELMALLDAAGIAYASDNVDKKRLSRAAFARARVVFVRSKVPHGDIVSTGDPLTDCLVSSPLTRSGKSDWADPRPSGKGKARTRKKPG